MRWVLRDSQIVSRVVSHLWAHWSECQQAGKPLEVICQAENVKRSSAANRAYWADLNQIAEQATPDGKRYTAEAFHELFKRHLLGVIELPGGATMGESTSTLNTREFLEYHSEVCRIAAEMYEVVFVTKEAA